MDVMDITWRPRRKGAYFQEHPIGLSQKDLSGFTPTTGLGIGLYG